MSKFEQFLKWFWEFLPQSTSYRHDDFSVTVVLLIIACSMLGLIFYGATIEIYELMDRNVPWQGRKGIILDKLYVPQRSYSTLQMDGNTGESTWKDDVIGEEFVLIVREAVVMGKTFKIACRQDFFYSDLCQMSKNIFFATRTGRYSKKIVSVKLL